MAHMFAAPAAPAMLPLPAGPAPAQQPIGTEPVKGSATPTFLGSAMVPSSGQAPAGNQKKLLGQ